MSTKDDISEAIANGRAAADGWVALSTNDGVLTGVSVLVEDGEPIRLSCPADESPDKAAILDALRGWVTDEHLRRIEARLDSGSWSTTDEDDVTLSIRNLD